jgi:GNAT superfamily N-acetyltransferase
LENDKYSIRYITAHDLAAHSELFTPHYNEVAKNKEVMVLNPDYEKYYALEKLGALLVIGVDYGEELVGYSLNFIHYNLHYSDLKVCQNDLLFLLPAHRESTAGLRLIKETEKRAVLHGCKLMLWHAKEGSPLDNILHRRKYPVQDIIYSKQL